MGTTTKNKSGSVIGGVILLAAVFGIMQFMSQHGNDIKGPDDLRKEHQDQVIFTISFNDTPRDPGVIVTSFVENVKWYDKTHDRTTTIMTWIPKGAATSVNAFQPGSGMLTCSAQLNGALVDTNTRDGQGSIRCWVNRKD